MHNSGDVPFNGNLLLPRVDQRDYARPGSLSSLSLSLFSFTAAMQIEDRPAALDVPRKMNRSVSLSRSVTNEKPAVTSFDSRRAQALDPHLWSRGNFARV